MGIVLPPGEGEVQVWYAPRYFWPAAAVSAVGLLVTLAVLLAPTARSTFGVTK